MTVTLKSPTLRARITALGARKRSLEARITEELKRPAPDMLRLQALKRLRLRAKDEIAALRARLGSRRAGAPRPTSA